MNYEVSGIINLRHTLSLFVGLFQVIGDLNDDQEQEVQQNKTTLLTSAEALTQRLNREH